MSRSQARGTSPPAPVASSVVARTADGVVTLTVCGALDASTAPGCARVLWQVLAELDPHEELVVDLRGLDVLAVAGARLLIEATHACPVPCTVVTGPNRMARAVLQRLSDSLYRSKPSHESSRMLIFRP
ncbi:STAS domain-containing protein [Dactylosporangium sp. NPDC051541]|uniref:STAS domain-containing protein n=1 Tax=Dactylosporangium sp. NPDC051541 TaxID=3363977 RepID=UPI00378B9AA9